MLDIFLEEKHQLQSGGNKCFTNNFFETIGHDGRQHDSHELFMKIFIPKKIKKLGAIEEPDAYDSFLFCFDSKFECLAANAIKEGNDGSEEIKVKFNEANKKKDIKSIHDVLNFIYDYLKNNYCNLSLFHTTIDTYCDHEGNGGKNCCKKYNIKITKSNEIEVDSYKVYNGLDFSSLIKKKEKEKLSGSCNYSHLKRGVAIYKEQTYHNFSDFLVINLKRFTNNQQSILNSIPIPDNICFDGDRYDITGIVCHFGDFSSGHYIAYKKNFGLWFEFDDSVVSVVGPSLPDAAVKCAYMLFFKKNKEIKEGGKEELKTIKKREIRSNEKSKIKAGKIPETLRKQVEERKKKEEFEKNKRKIFLSKLLPYYSLFNKMYFEIKNKDVETFVEYLHDIVKDIKKNDTQYILNLKKEYELQFCAFLLLKVQEYCNLSKRIKEIGRNSNKLNEIHEEKPNEEELEKLEKDIIMLIYKDPSPDRISKENNMSFFLKEFVKVFFISFCDFDNTCGEKRLFKEDTLQSLKNGGVEFFFNKDKNINISENRDLPFFLITHTPIKDQQDGVREDDPKEVGDTKSAGDGKYYCFWSDKLIIARDKKKQANDDNLLNTDKNEINEGNKINIEDSKDINADYDSFENLAVFKKTFEVAGCGFFERLQDGDKSKYSIKNILGDVQNERKQKLDPLLSFIGKIEVFIKDFVGKINKGIEECYEKIRKKDQNFFAGKKEEIKKEYVQQIDDLGKCIAIANEYKKKLDWELKDFKKAIDQTDDKIKKVVKQIDERKEDIKKKQLAAGAQYNTQGILFKFKSKTQVFGEGNKKSIQPEDYKNKLEQLKKELEVLCANKENITDSISQVEKEVSRVETFIESREKEKKKLEDVLKNAEMNFDQYEKRLTRYFQYYKGWENKEEEENKKKWKNKENGKNKEVLTVLSKLKNDITAVLERKEEYTIQSFNINFKDIFNPFNSYSFDLFVSMIEKEIEESIIGEYLIFDLYEHLCFEKGTSKRVLVESGQRFKGVQNLSNTCYINSILQNLVEFKDDLLLIKDCPHDKKSGPTATTIHDTVFEVLGEKGTDPRIGLQNVLNISITNGFGNTGDPVEVYSSLLNYYINEQYRIEVVEGSEVGDFVYEILKENDPSRCNARLILPSGNKEINDIDIINYLYNEEINKSIKKYFPVSAGPCVFKNTIKSKYCEKCKKKEIKIEIECFPYCLIKIGEFIAKANNISDVVKETFGEGIEEEKKEGIDCDGVCIGKKTAKVKESSFYRVMNNCLCFNFAYDRGATNFIDIEDEVKVGDKVYESVCACYYTPGHYIAFKKINDIWFKFNDDDVSPIIDKSLPKTYGEYKPTLVFYKKKKKDKK